ncbi:MAG: DUF2851 family protein [Nitrospinae bacterium]|nr:DUF2851 family protein [Nitrospinota bacterium]
MEDQIGEKLPDSYLKLTRVFNQFEVREEDHTLRVPEKVIRCIWNDQLFCTPRLKTQDGRSLEIIYPGHWNFGKGPDFTNATIKVDGKIYEGDVELHVYATDWDHHGHSTNPDFDNVILHVYMWQGRGIKHSKINLKKNPAFDFEIKDYLTQGLLDLNNQLDFETYPVLNQCNVGLCHEPLSGLPEEQLLHLLNTAGEARILKKQERFHDPIIVDGYEQTFYRGVAEALGYPDNKKPFQVLADHLPLSTLKDSVPEEFKDEERVLHYQAILLGASGLMESQSWKEISALRKWVKIWDGYKDSLPESPLTKKHWSFRSIRPANYPYRRIAGLAHLLVFHEKKGMFADFVHQVSQLETENVPRKQIDSFFKFFCVDAKDYWSQHYTPGGKKLTASQQLIGAERSREIIINIGLPVGFIFASAGKFLELEKRLSLIFQTRRGSGDNKLIRFMKHYIFGDQKERTRLLASEKHMHGLMQIYQDFCTQSQNNCLRCPFPEVVTNYFP